MSTTELEKSGSVIELERFPTTSQLSVATFSTTVTREFDDAERGSIQEVERSVECFERVSRSQTLSATETQAEDERARSVDEVLPQRNVSELAPTDEGFHAWAFVSVICILLPNSFSHPPFPSLSLRSSSRELCGRSQPRMVPF